MQEVTRVIDLQLTGIFKTDEHERVSEEIARKLAKGIKEILCLDDVQVLSIKDFVRNIEEA